MLQKGKPQTLLSHSLETLFLTLGLLTGAGVGLATTPGIILTARYFDKKRSRANALCLSGAAAGAFTLPVFFTFLLDTYGFRGSLPVIGACLLHICISAALYRSAESHLKEVWNLCKSTFSLSTHWIGLQKPF